ncbi:hypothetical protein STEG23_033758, partial [Scotinomys teguina]
ASIQKLMEAEVEIHSQEPGQAPGVQWNGEKRDYMCKRHQDHDGETYRDTQTNLVGTQELWTNNCGTCLGLD